MATITKSNNSIVIQTENSSHPVTISNWEDAKCTYSDDFVMLTFGNQGFVFGVWDITPMGELETVNGIDVSAMTNAEIATIIKNNVLTEDAFSGTPVLIDDTTMVEGQFTCLQVMADAVLDVSDAAATVEVDAEGTAIDVSDYAGITFTQGNRIYGKFTQVQLVSGSVKAYSNL